MWQANNNQQIFGDDSDRASEDGTSEDETQLLDIDDLIWRLTENYDPQSPPELSAREVGTLCLSVRHTLLSEPMLLRLAPGLFICGDVHGQYSDLLCIFKRCGTPPNQRFLFLGDYVDRGRNGVETMCLLLAYKLRYPDRIHLLRGNHECEMITKVYGFLDEVCDRWSVRMWRVFCDVFEAMPVAALIGDRVLCMHGGPSPELESLQQIEHLPRPTVVPPCGLMCDLLWADPDKRLSGWSSNLRGISFTFGADIVHALCKKLDVDFICRAHQVARDGYEFFADGRLITIFSAPNYCGEFDNDGCALYITDAFECLITVFRPRRSPSRQRA